MLVSLAVAAALLSLPELDARVADRIQARPPRAALRADRSFAVSIRLVLDSTGEVHRCEPISIVGEEEDALHVCSIIERLEFGVPVGGDGRPIFGMLETFIKFELSGARNDVGRLAQAPHLTFAAPSLPESADILDFEVLAEVAQDGDVVACDRPADVPDNFSTAVCDYLEGEGLSPLKDNKGNEVEYVTRLKVRFESAESS